MNRILFTAAGCARCSIARKFMQKQGIGYEEHDIGGEGKEIFNRFYRDYRGVIVRGKEGIEFPILADGALIRQGVAGVIAHLHAGTRLDGFMGRSELAQGWVGGLHVSGGDAGTANDLVEVLGFMRRNGLKLELDTDGRNASVLRALLDQKIGDRVVMDLKGPRALYGELLGEGVDPEEICLTMRLVTKFPEYRFETTVVPVLRREEGSSPTCYLTPEEIEETARWLKEATDGSKHPYFLRLFDPETCADEGLRAAKKLPPEALFRYRSAARKHQELTEIKKSS
jgi:pyruvate formate lyase activating enzyme